LVRLLRRRWLTAIIVFAAVFGGYWAFSTVTERIQFRARARVLISTPPILVTASQGAQWITVSQMEPKTWYSIIAGRRIRELSEQALKASVSYPVKPEWFTSVTPVPETDSQLVWIEALAPTSAIAADIANVVAKQVEIFSKDVANREIREARAKTQERLDKESRIQTDEEAGTRRIRDDARTRLGSENLDLDVRKFEEEVLFHETRRRDLERRAATNRLRIERVLADRSVAEHLQREGIPRLGSASSESRVSESLAVRSLGERLETIHRDLLTALRKYTEEHPLVKALRSDIRHSEIELARVRIQALGRDMDKEELALRTDNELAAIELRVLAPEVRTLRERLGTLAPLLEKARIHDRAMLDSRDRASTINTLLAQLAAAPETGYVQRLPGEEALPQDATAVEMKMRKSWPVAIIAALIMAISFAFLLEFVDTSLRNDYDVRRHMDYPVLAAVPRVRPEEVLTVRASRVGVMSEIYDTLATVLLSTPSERPSRIFIVTGANPKEGKTAVSINLAVALARQGKRTLLVDGDMRIPSIHAALAMANAVGLSDVLSGQILLSAEGLLQEVEVPNLKVLTSGASPENPYELLDPVRIAPIADQIRGQFDTIVIDTPPILRTGDALKLSTIADATIFVVEAGKTDQRQATWAKRLLTNVGAHVAGVILNRASIGSEEYYYYGRYSQKEARSAG
jgi:capsular exopolysaccharide synthesis family protein